MKKAAVLELAEKLRGVYYESDHDRQVIYEAAQALEESVAHEDENFYELEGVIQEYSFRLQDSPTWEQVAAAIAHYRTRVFEEAGLYLQELDDELIEASIRRLRYGLEGGSIGAEHSHDLEQVIAAACELLRRSELRRNA